APPSLVEREAILLEHLDLMLSEYGTSAGLSIARKHMSWAIRGLDGAGQAREALFAAETPDEARALIVALYRACDPGSLAA
ncbi:MAG: tRNA-dihydrouridine synthase, partial [Rhodospirillaceae bacterium]|nr:tRNA-dihydrouridine synthase [Rhodospirillaceae bacterium]